MNNLLEEKEEFITSLIKIRNDKGITQTELERISGVKQPIIARLEKMTTSPNLDTIIKILDSMDKKLAIIDK